MKKWIMIILMTIGTAAAVSSMVWFFWVYPKNYEYALQLADDASLPGTKADYLQEYIDRVKEITGPPRYIFMTPDLKLDTQRKILDGLITRFRDIAKLSPSEMAYQQGMAQLTGQEMNHQLERISGIFQAAALRENPLMFIFFTFMSWPFIVIGLGLLLINY